MTGADLPCDVAAVPGLRLRRFAGDADFALMAAVANASFAADGIATVRRAEEIRSDYAKLRQWDPARDIAMAEFQGQLAGYARTWHWTAGDGALLQAHLAFVHPAHRPRGVGRALLQWAEARQREVARAHPGAAAWLHHANVSDAESERAQLLRDAGYQAVRNILLMRRATLDDIPDFPLPHGFEVRPVRDEHLRAIYDAHMEALRDAWGYSPPAPGDYDGWLKARTFQPHLWQVAWHVESNEVAGQVKPWIDAEQNETQGRRRGYTEFISVGARWRRRGLARALVVRALHAQREAGMEESELGVDGESAFHAARLYEACGFAVARRNVVYRKPVDVGA